MKFAEWYENDMQYLGDTTNTHAVQLPPSPFIYVGLYIGDSLGLAIALRGLRFEGEWCN